MRSPARLLSLEPYLWNISVVPFPQILRLRCGSKNWTGLDYMPSGFWAHSRASAAHAFLVLKPLALFSILLVEYYAVTTRDPAESTTLAKWQN